MYRRPKEISRVGISSHLEVVHPALTTYSADTRKLLTFVLHAREQPSTWQFLRIISSALQHSAQLPSHDFDSVRCDIRGVLDIIGEYFSSSGIEDVVRGHAWRPFSFFLDACVELAQVDTARNGPFFTQNVVNALECCASQCPESNGWYFLIRPSMSRIYSILGYSAGLYVHHSVAEATVGFAPMPQDGIDEAPREHSRAVEETPVV